jgi:Rrf2 family protein
MLISKSKHEIHHVENGGLAMISQTAEYALRAVVAIARESKPLVTAQIAQIAHVPEGYLHKVLQQLTRGGLLLSQRGLNGGYRLAVSPEILNVLEVVNAVDPPRRIERCPLGLPEHREHLCPLHIRIAEAFASLEKAFAETTIQELLTDHRYPPALGGRRPNS